MESRAWGLMNTCEAHGFIFPSRFSPVLGNEIGYGYGWLEAMQIRFTVCSPKGADLWPFAAKANRQSAVIGAQRLAVKIPFTQCHHSGQYNGHGQVSAGRLLLNAVYLRLTTPLGVCLELAPATPPLSPFRITLNRIFKKEGL